MALKTGIKVRQYIIENVIAKGGMGVVWRALDTGRNEAVAIKSVASDLVSDPQFRVRISDEASRHRRLQHPNIVPLYDIFEAEGEICIVMKLVAGRSLSDLLKTSPNNRPGVEESIRIIKDVLKALDYAHMHGVVHRDMKPSNVLLDGNGHAIVIDFGIAIAMGEERRTRTGQIVGTPVYMSPEQITSPRNIDHRSDVYSVGCMFYEMLTGRPPFCKGEDGVDASEFAIQRAHVKEMPVNPRIRVKSISADLAEIVMGALEKEPDKRIPGCGEFLRLLDEAGKSPATPLVEKLKDPRSSKVAWIVGVLLIVLAVFLLLAVDVYWSHHH